MRAAGTDGFSHTHEPGKSVVLWGFTCEATFLTIAGMTNNESELDKALAARRWRYDTQTELFMDGERQLDFAK